MRTSTAGPAPIGRFKAASSGPMRPAEDRTEGSWTGAAGSWSAMYRKRSVRPSQTTVSAVAERAGVERLTVYRHFRDETEMPAACSHRYFEINPPPNPSDWAGELDPVRRTRRALEDLYGFFGRTAPMFEKVYRDAGMSEAVKKVVGQFDAHLRGMADGLATAWPWDKAAARRRVILRHATKFATWQSLEADGVDNEQKVALLLEWLSERS